MEFYTQLPLCTTCVFKVNSVSVSASFYIFVSAIKSFYANTASPQKQTRAIFMNETTIKLKLMVEWSDAVKKLNFVVKQKTKKKEKKLRQ